MSAKPFLAKWEDVQLYNQIQAALEQLTQRQRECWLLHFGRGFSYAQIGVQTGLAKSTVKEHVDRAQRRIEELVREAA